MPKPILIIFQVGVVSKWTDDSQRLLLEHFDEIKNTPSHIYHSALPFSPSSSWLHKYYSTDPSFAVKVVKGLPAEWGKCSHAVFLVIHIYTLSCWNNTVAVGSGPGNIIILDTITGSHTAVLSAHTHAICVTFSSDGTSFVSGSWDHTVKLWDVQTGGVVKTFSGHTDLVWSVSISAGCTIIASGSRDNTIRLWDTQTEECQCVIRQQGDVRHVSFSPTNPQHLISICDKKLWQWDTNGHQISPPFDASCVAFSPNGTQFVLCYGAAVTIQNSNSGAIVAKFQVTNGDVLTCCFTLDGRLVAVAAGRVIYVWDITGSDSHPVETLIGHTDDITCLTFSSPSTLISASRDGWIRFWQISALSTDLAMTDPESTPTPLPLVSSISLQARDGVAISSDTDGVVKTWDIPASLCKGLSESPAEDYKDGDVKLINSRLVFVWYRDERVNIWDPEKGKYLLQENVSGEHLLDLRISGDGSQIFWINVGFIQVWDMWTGEAVCRVKISDRKPELRTMDGSKVWIRDSHAHLGGWDFGTPGSPPVRPSTKPPDTLYLNGTKLWDNRQCRIQDTVTGKVVFQLSGQFQGHITEVQWNGQYLFISLGSAKELILEFPPALLQ